MKEERNPRYHRYTQEEDGKEMNARDAVIFYLFFQLLLRSCIDWHDTRLLVHRRHHNH